MLHKLTNLGSSKAGILSIVIIRKSTIFAAIVYVISDIKADMLHIPTYLGSSNVGIL